MKSSADIWRRTVEVTQGQANISLSETQSDAFVFELLCELLQFLGGKILLKSRKKKKIYIFLMEILRNRWTRLKAAWYFVKNSDTSYLLGVAAPSAGGPAAPRRGGRVLRLGPAGSRGRVHAEKRVPWQPVARGRGGHGRGRCAGC